MLIFTHLKLEMLIGPVHSTAHALGDFDYC